MRLSFLTLCALFSGHLLAVHPAMPAPDVEPPVPTDCAAIADFLEGQVMVMTHTAVYGEACFTIQSLVHFGTDGQANELDNQGQFLGSFPYLVTEVDGQCALARDAADCAVQFLSFNGDQTQVIMSRNGSDATLQPSDCPFPPTVTAATLASATSSLTAQDGALTVTAEVGFSTSLPIASIELAGINGAADYSFPMPGPVEGIGAGLYSVSALDGSDCESEAVTVLVSYDLCCACGVSDADVDGLCDDEDNCANRKAINYADPANVPCIIPGCMDPAFIQYDADATEDNGSCTTPVVEGCTDPAYLEYDASANTDDGSCTTPVVEGCTDPAYLEYDASANTDDGSCTTPVVEGCTDPAYVEYDASANTDDGSCTTPVVEGCTDPAYIEYNASANTDDGSCSTLIVEGCTDPAYIEYNAEANTDDGSCITLVIAGCMSPNNALYNPQANTDDGSCSATCVDVALDSYVYDVVLIGDQCWFAENLRTTIYRNGANIPEITSDVTWASTNSGACCYYDNSAGYLATYGRLYNWFAVNTGLLCPSGWHVPTDGEWTELEDYITSQGFAGTEGTALKSTTGWYYNGNGTDDFGFSALPGGYRQAFSIDSDFYGDFKNRRSSGGWWSSSIHNSSYFWYRALFAVYSDLDREISSSPGYGHSIRCLRDGE